MCVSVFVALMWRQKTLIKSELAQLDRFIKIYAVPALRNSVISEPDLIVSIADYRSCLSHPRKLTPTLDGASEIRVIITIVDHLLEGFLLGSLRWPGIILLESIDAILGYGWHSGW